MSENKWWTTSNTACFDKCPHLKGSICELYKAPVVLISYCYIEQHIYRKASQTVQFKKGHLREMRKNKERNEECQKSNIENQSEEPKKN